MDLESVARMSESQRSAWRALLESEGLRPENEAE